MGLITVKISGFYKRSNALWIKMLKPRYLRKLLHN